MILLDTNVLVYAINEDSPQHPKARAVVTAALEGAIPGVLVPQVLLEAFAVLTDRRRVKEPLAPEEAWAVLDRLCSGLRVLPVERGALDLMVELVSLRRPEAQEVFDVFLVAQMRAAGISTVCTYDLDGFRAYPGIVALTPDDLLAGR